jgi:hypothetical protein
MAEKQVYPRLPVSNWWTLRNQFKKTIPSAVTSSYLKSLLNLTSDRAAGNLLPPLKQFGLIDDDGKPTSRANDWRSDTKYKETCDKIISEIYPQELRDLYSGPDLDRQAIKEWFMHDASLGEGAARISAAIYILLNEGNPKEDNDTEKKSKSNSPNVKNNNGKAVKLEQGKKSVSMETETTTTSIATNRDNQSISPTIHVDLQIHISPEASAEQIDIIFSSIAKHLYGK